MHNQFFWLRKLSASITMSIEKVELGVMGMANGMKGNLNPQKHRLRITQGHRINIAASVTLPLISFLFAAS